MSDFNGVPSVKNTLSVPCNATGSMVINVEDMDEGAHMDDNLRSAMPYADCNKRIKVMEAGGSGGGHMADAAKHKDQRGEWEEMRASLKAKAATIQQDMLDGIVGFGCTGYVFSLK